MIPGESTAKRTVSLTIHDIRGRYVRTLVEGSLEPGEHRVVWNGKNSRGENISSGIYLYTLRTETGTLTRKMIVLQ